MKHKIIIIINILFIFLVVGLAILQYFWLEKVRISEFYRMKRELRTASAKIIFHINYDLLKIYNIFHAHKDEIFKNNHRFFLIKFNELINNKNIKNFFDSILLYNNFSNNNEITYETIYQKKTKNYTKLNSQIEYLNDLSKNYGVQFFYYITFIEKGKIIIPQYIESKTQTTINKAIIIYINDLFLNKDYFPSLINDYFNYNNLSDYIIEIININYDKPIYSTNHKLKKYTNADITYPIYLNIPKKFMTDNNFKKYNNN